MVAPPGPLRLRMRETLRAHPGGAQVASARRYLRESWMEDQIEVGPGGSGFWSTTFPLTVPGATSQEVSIRHGFFGGLKVLVDDERAKRGSRRTKYLIPRSDGTELEVTVRPGGYGTAPVIVSDSDSASIGRRIEGAEWIWVGLPLLLPAYAIFGQGGYLDIFAGFLAFAANIRIFVNDGLTPGTRYLYSLGSVALFAGIYVASVVIVFVLLQ